MLSATEREQFEALKREIAMLSRDIERVRDESRQMGTEVATRQDLEIIASTIRGAIHGSADVLNLLVDHAMMKAFTQEQTDEINGKIEGIVSKLNALLRPLDRYAAPVVKPQGPQP